MISLIVVDDHKIVCDGIKAFTLGSKKIQVIGAAGNGPELFELLKSKNPDVIILDISLPGMSGIEITQKLSAQFPAIKVLILSANDEAEVIINAIHAGANGFLNKDTSKEEFCKAIEAVYEGEGYFGENLSNLIFKSYISKVKMNKSQDENKPALSEREKEVVKLFSDGLSFKEIGDKLHISPRTVETHKNNILEKLELKNTVELVKYSIKVGIVRL